MLQLAVLFALGGASLASAVNVLPGSSPLISWGGRTVDYITGGEGKSFDWLGVQARFAVNNATWVAVSATATGSQGRGTRFRSYFKENGYQYFQGAIVWVVDGNSSLNRGFSSNTSVIWQGNPWEGREYQVHTLENMVPAQYHTGVTTIHSFQSDGTFVPLNATDKLGGAANRRMEFIGDSITAATNVNRPEGARAGCGDSGFQADWSQTYSALLCHRFGAACSTIAYGGKCMMREHNCTYALSSAEPEPASRGPIRRPSICLARSPPRSSRLSDRHAATTPRRIQRTSCGAMSACGHAHTHAYAFRWGPPDAGLLSLVHVDWCDRTAPFSTFPT
jgi:hypothetical protein